MLVKVVTYTNIYIVSISENFQREKDARHRTLIETHTFISLSYFCGVHKSSYVNMQDLSATDVTGFEIFYKTMPYEFFFLNQDVCFDYIGARVVRKESGKLAPKREFFENFVNNCQK
ncbi:hypothetical protein X975_18705, partial [Stegodyphus mimosarum]